MQNTTRRNILKGAVALTAVPTAAFANSGGNTALEGLIAAYEQIRSECDAAWIAVSLVMDDPSRPPNAELALQELFGNEYPGAWLHKWTDAEALAEYFQEHVDRLVGWLEIDPNGGFRHELDEQIAKQKIAVAELCARKSQRETWDLAHDLDGLEDRAGALSVMVRHKRMEIAEYPCNTLKEVQRKIAFCLDVMNTSDEESDGEFIMVSMRTMAGTV